MAQDRSRFGQLLGAVNSVVGATRRSQRLLTGMPKAFQPTVFAAFSAFFLRLRWDIPDIAKQGKVPDGQAVGDLETLIRTILGRFGDKDEVVARSLQHSIEYDPDQTVEDLPGDLTRVIAASRDSRILNPRDNTRTIWRDNSRDPKNPRKLLDVDPKDKQISLPDGKTLGVFDRYWLAAVDALDFRNKVLFGITFSVREGMLSREDITKQMSEFSFFGEGLTKYVEYPDKLEDGQENEGRKVFINEIIELLDVNEQDETGKDLKDSDNNPIPVEAYILRDYRQKPRYIVRQDRIRQLYLAMKRLGINMPVPLGGAVAAKILGGDHLNDAERTEYVAALRQDAYLNFLRHLYTWTTKARRGSGWGDAPQLLWMGVEAIWAGVGYNDIKADILHALLDVADQFALVKSRDRKMVRGDYGRKDAIALLDKGLFSHLSEDVDYPRDWDRLSEGERKLFHLWNPTRSNKEAELLREADMFELRKIALRYNAMLPVDSRDVISLISGGAGWGWYKDQEGNPAPDEFGEKLGALAQHVNERNWLAKLERRRVIATFDPSDDKQRAEIRKAYEDGEVPIDFFDREEFADMELDRKRMGDLSTAVAEAFPDRLEEIFGDLAKEIG